MRDTYLENWFSDGQRVQRELQLFFLDRLFRNNSNMVFKGGTALDLFYGSGRFSENLDFDCKDMNVLTEINDVIGSLKREEGYAVFNDWKAERELHRNFTRYVLRVSSKKSGDIVSFMIDCTIDSPKYPPDNLVLNYNDSLVGINVMKIEEILAEKVSAILNRKKARDLYDLYHLAVVRRVPINMKDVYEKCTKRFSAKEPKAYSFRLFKNRVDALSRRWRDLDVLLQNPEDYKFAEVSGKVLELFKSL
jgi:predicted nucleotidyltransferase component of viral defense system